MSITLTQSGFKEAQEFFDLEAEEQLEHIVEVVLWGLKHFGADITPVDTGAMQDSWRTEATGLVGRMFTSPAAINPRSGKPVNTYACIVDERIGLLDTVIDVAWPRIAVEGLEVFRWR